MAQGNFSLRMAALQEPGRFSVETGVLLEWPGSGPASGAVSSGIPSGLASILADARSGLQQLVRGQERLLALVDAIKGRLASQGSLLMTLNERQALTGQGGADAETAKASVLDSQPFSHLKPAIALEAAMVELKREVPLSIEQQRELLTQSIKLANQPLVAPTGAVASDLLRVELAAAKAGIGVEGSGAAARAQPQQLMDFARDAAVLGSGLGLKVKQAGELLLGWHKSMNLDSGQRLDLADATQHLGSGLKVSAADIGSILGRHGAAGMAAGMAPEQSAALLAALLKSGADQASAGVAFNQFAQALAQGDKASLQQRAAWQELGLDPQALARDMRSDAPQTIQTVLAALQAQPAARRSALASELFADNGALLGLLPRLDGLAQAFALVADKQQYAASQGQGQGALNKAAQEAAQTPQAQWNRLDAQMNGFKSSVGSAVLADYGGSLNGAGAVLQKLGELAQSFPHVAAALAVAVATLQAAVKIKTSYKDVRDLFSRSGKPSGGGGTSAGPNAGGAASRLRARLGPQFSRMASSLSSLASRGANAAQQAARGLATVLAGLGPRVAAMARQAAVRVGSSAGQMARGLVSALSGLTARVSASARQAATGVGTVAAGLRSRVATTARSAGAKVRSMVGRGANRSGFSGQARDLGRSAGKGLGRRLLGKLFRPLSLVEASSDALAGWREGNMAKAGAAVGSVGAGLAGGYAGAAAGAALGTLIFPGVGTAIGGLLGGTLGSLGGGEAGAWLGDKLGHQVDRLATPEAVSQDLSAAQQDNRQINFAPVLQIYGQDHASAQQLADQVVQQLQAQWLSLAPLDSLAVRRGAALTDGVVG